MKPRQTFLGHTGDVNSVAVSSDGRMILSGSSDMTIRLWDINSGAETHRFVANTGVEIGVVCFADGLTAASTWMNRQFAFGICLLVRKSSLAESTTRAMIFLWNILL